MFIFYSLQLGSINLNGKEFDMKPGIETRTSPLSKHSLYNVYNRKTPDKEGKNCITGGKLYLLVRLAHRISLCFVIIKLLALFVSILCLVSHVLYVSGLCIMDFGFLLFYLIARTNVSNIDIPVNADGTTVF